MLRNRLPITFVLYLVLLLTLVHYYNGNKGALLQGAPSQAFLNTASAQPCACHTTRLFWQATSIRMSRPITLHPSTRPPHLQSIQGDWPTRFVQSLVGQLQEHVPYSLYFQIFRRGGLGHKVSAGLVTLDRFTPFRPPIKRQHLGSFSIRCGHTQKKEILTSLFPASLNPQSSQIQSVLNSTWQHAQSWMRSVRRNPADSCYEPPGD